MMYWYGSGWGWMMLMPLAWLLLIGVIIWAAVRFVPRPERDATPREILDLRYARGEIDTDSYEQARAHLAGSGSRSP